jgi:hypothetical protein
MRFNRVLAGAIAFAPAFLPAQAAEADYRFELVGTPQKDIVQVRLLHAADSTPVADAVIFETTADMGPSGMAAMAVPVKPLPAKDGVYSFEIDPAMSGTYALHLAAKVQGEPDTVRGTITADLVK